MEEQAQTKEGLSEEQLQAISGGCLLCEANKAEEKYHRSVVLRGQEGLENAHRRGDPAAVAQMLAGIGMHQVLRAYHASARAAREATPGHVAIQPGERGYVDMAGG